MVMDKEGKFLYKIFFKDFRKIELLNYVKEITHNYKKEYIKALLDDIEGYFWRNAEEYNDYLVEKRRVAEWLSEHEAIFVEIPPKINITYADNQTEILGKLSINNSNIESVVKNIYHHIPLMPTIQEGAIKRTIQEKLALIMLVLNGIYDWLNKPSVQKCNDSILGKYEDLNLEGICEAYDQYETLYNGVWVQLGNYPEEGQYNPDPKEREQALNILKGLYGKIKQYEQQIKSDCEYLKDDLWAFSHIKEKLSCLDMICRDYHNKIEFIENLNVGSEQDIASTPIKKVNVITKANKKYFDRAVAKGYAEENNGAYIWKNKKVMLGYFVYKVYCQDVTDEIPYKAVEELFGVPRLDSTIYGLNSAKKEQKWKWKMDKEIFFD